MLELGIKVISGIDLAGKPENPTGWAVLEKLNTKASLLYNDNQILEAIAQNRPEIIAIDAPFSLPNKGILRKAEKEMMKSGYRVLPPSLPAMEKLADRVMKLNRLIAEEGFKTIEVHPTSTCKALEMPPKNRRKTQAILKQMGLEGELELRPFASHEIDAVIAALTAYLYMKNQTEALGDEKEGYIIVPKRKYWRTLEL